MEKSNNPRQTRTPAYSGFAPGGVICFVRRFLVIVIFEFGFSYHVQC